MVMQLPSTRCQSLVNRHELAHMSSSLISQQLQQHQHQHYEDYRIALYYCYVTIPDISAHVKWHQQMCQGITLYQGVGADVTSTATSTTTTLTYDAASKDPQQQPATTTTTTTTIQEDVRLNGRIRVAAEGINGVLSGRWSHLRMYEDQLRAELDRVSKNTLPNNDEIDVLPPWELDVKYCRLRDDLPVHVQLFDTLLVQSTHQVVSLVDWKDASIGVAQYQVQSSSSSSQNMGRHRRRRQRQRKNQQNGNSNMIANVPEICSHDPNQQPSIRLVGSGENVNPHNHLDPENNHRYDHPRSTTVYATPQEILQQCLSMNSDTGAGSTCIRPVPYLSPAVWDATLADLERKQSEVQLTHTQTGSHDSHNNNSNNHNDTTNDNNNNNKREVILLDCRNAYESAVGYFAAPAASTLLANTRKFTDLPAVLHQHIDRLASSSHIFMYCTGGVRCERASQYLQHILLQEQKARQQTITENNPDFLSSTLPKIYQLHGGIQRYLEATVPSRSDVDHSVAVVVGTTTPDPDTDKEGAYKDGMDTDNNKIVARADTDQQQDVGETKGEVMGALSTTLSSSSTNSRSSFFFGKNFVFDPRRTDPVFVSGTTVGKCCVCHQPHDDYDNGHAPIEACEARCCTCRILLLVCLSCRPTVTCWGESEAVNEDEQCTVEAKPLQIEEEPTPTTSVNELQQRIKPKLYCGGLEGAARCLHSLPVQVVTYPPPPLRSAFVSN